MSIFSGKGLFTTSNAGSAHGHAADWIAYQADPEGDISFDPRARTCFWMARPTQEVADRANRLDVPFIAQAENHLEMETTLGLHLTVPKALLGSPDAWTPDQLNRAIAAKWDLILEWYWNEQPWYTSPNAGNYPYFRNVCFGTYPAETPPNQGRRVPVSEYRRVWKGAFSCWPAEAMTPGDWEAFDA